MQTNPSVPGKEERMKRTPYVSESFVQRGPGTFRKSRLQFGTENTVGIFCFGFVFGMLLVNLMKNVLLDEMGLLDEQALFRLKYMSLNSSTFFFYVFRKRILLVLGLIILTTTYLGKIACTAATAWSGITLGVFLTTLTLRYGLKGQVLAVVWLFPQFLLYVPAFLLLLGWGEQFYRSIYYGVGEETGGKRFSAAPPGVLVLIIALVVGGCLMEAYLNPGILTGYLRNF